MGEFSTGKFVNLSHKIFVPDEWPVKGLEKFILKLTKLVINDVTSDRIIILQVQDIPTRLRSCKKNEKTRYFFERISKPVPIDAYVIDVVIAKIDNSSQTISMESDDLSQSSTNDGSDSDKGISLDNYNIEVRHSENRTAYYFILIQENVDPLSIERETHRQPQRYSARRAKRQAMSYDIVLLLLTAIGIAALLYLATTRTI